MNLRRSLLALAVLLAPYFYLYVSKYFTFYTWINHVPVPLGDDYPLHVYFILKSCKDPLEIFQGQYPSLIHHVLSLIAACDFWTAAWAVTAISLALIPAGIAAWALLFKKLAGATGITVAAVTILAMPRLLQSVGDGQIPEKFVLLVVTPAVLYLYLSGRSLTAGVVAGGAAWVSFLGATYTVALAISTASIPLIAAAAAVVLPRLPVALHTAGEALASDPPLYYPPLQASMYAYFNPVTLPALFAVGIYLATKRPKTAALFYTAAALWAAAYLFPQLNERLIRSASFILAAATVAMSLELKTPRALLLAVAALASGPAAVGWAWAASHVVEVPYGEELKQRGLFMPAVRTAACKFETYKYLAETLPTSATVSVAWQLDLWLLPYLYQYRPDVSVKVVVCPQDLTPPYVISGRHPDSWYLPCYHTIPPGPCYVHHEDTSNN